MTILLPPFPLENLKSFFPWEKAKRKLKFALALSKCIPTASRADAFSDMKAREEYDIDSLEAEEKTAITDVYEAFLSAEHRAMLENMEHLAQTGKDSKKVIMQFLSNFNTTFVITDDINTPADFALYYLHDEFKSKLEAGELKSEYPTVNGVDWTSAEELIGKFIFVAWFIPNMGYMGVIICEPIIWCVMTIQLAYSFYKNPEICKVKKELVVR